MLVRWAPAPRDAPQSLPVGIWLCIRSQLRSRWAAWTVVALLIGLAGGVVLATAAGARRTASAYPRFLRETKAADVLVSPNNTGFPGYYEALQNVPGAAAIAPVVGVGAAPVADPTDPVLVQAPTNASLGRAVEGAKLLAGRLPRPDHADEVLADALAARHFHLHVGSEFPVVLATREQELPDPSSGPHVNLRVVGIGVTRDNVLPANALASQPTLVAGPALFGHPRSGRGAVVAVQRVRRRTGAPRARHRPHGVHRRGAGAGGQVPGDLRCVRRRRG